MIKQETLRHYRVWAIVDVAIASLLFTGLLAQPSMQRIDFPADASAWTLGLSGIAVGLGWAVVQWRLGLYGIQRSWTQSRRFVWALSASALGGLLLSTLAFTLDAPVDRIFPLCLAAAFFAVQTATRAVFAGMLLVAEGSATGRRHVLIVGAGPLAAAAAERVAANPGWGIDIVGFVDEGHSDFVPSVPVEDIHKFIDLPMLLRNHSIDEVMVACPRGLIGTLEPVVRECALIGVPVVLLSDLFGDVLPPPRVGRFDSRSTLNFAPVHHSRLELQFKRGLDFTGALIGLLVAAPILAMAAVAIRLDSKGPTLFRQVRCGLNGRRFEMLKLRTMTVDAEAQKAALQSFNEMDGPVFKMKDDPRVTRVGRFLRASSIDELPQLWNVLKGDMSLVGPRPPTPDEVLQYAGSERRRLSMRPGLTCLWQISGRNELSFDQWMSLDLQYIDNWSLGSDLRIICATVPTVLTGRGAS